MVAGLFREEDSLLSSWCKIIRSKKDKITHLAIRPHKRPHISTSGMVHSVVKGDTEAARTYESLILRNPGSSYFLCGLSQLLYRFLCGEIQVLKFHEN